MTQVAEYSTTATPRQNRSGSGQSEEVDGFLSIANQMKKTRKQVRILRQTRRNRPDPVRWLAKKLLRVS